MNKTQQFETLYATYIAKLARIDELKAMGRHGYQLRMPKKSLAIAAAKLREFGAANGIEVESLLS